MSSNDMKVDEENETKPLNFHELELNDRILKAVAKLGWLQPTLIQEKAIPLMLEGKDILIRARTGYGKTAAFVIPMIQKILINKRYSQYSSTLIPRSRQGKLGFQF